MTSMGPFSSSAWATTWLLVMTWPWSSYTKPEPVAPCSLPSYSATTCTVLGSTLSATEAMLPLSAGSGAAVRRSTASVPPGPLSFIRAAARTPPVSPRTSATAATAGSIHAGTRARRGRSGAG